MAPTDLLGEFEQLVLLSILQNRDQAHALPIRHTIERVTSRDVSRGALYRTLDRLEQKGLIRSSVEPGSERRGGYAQKRFEVRAPGVRALQRSQRVFDEMRRGLEDHLGEVS